MVKSVVESIGNALDGSRRDKSGNELVEQLVKQCARCDGQFKWSFLVKQMTIYIKLKANAVVIALQVSGNY